MRLFTIFAALACLLVTADPGSAQEQINRADRKAMRETRDTMRSLAQDLRTLYNINDEYPEELKAVVDSKLRESVPQDAWGREFAYQLSDEHGYELTSWGADGAAGGEGGDADIVWTPAGELRELTAEEKAERERIRDEQRFQGRRVVARARMVVLGRLVVDSRRENEEWPEALSDVKPDGDSDMDKEKRKCFTDPWGNEFAFKLLPHENFAVICYGRDGEEGGKGRDADFVITEREVRLAMQQDRGRGGFMWRSYNRDWQMRELATSVQEYKEKHGKLPERLEDLTKGGPGKAVRGSLPRDNWGNPYVYVKTDDDTFHIVALGEDQIAGGIGDNKDAMSPKAGGVPKEEPWDVARVEPPRPKINEDEVRVEVADETMRNLVEQANAYHAEHGEYPESLEDLEDRLPGKEVPLDPWDNAYHYERTADEDGNFTGFTVTCLGSDGAEGGDGKAADFSYNQELERTPSVTKEDAEAGADDAAEADAEGE